MDNLRPITEARALVRVLENDDPFLQEAGWIFMLTELDLLTSDVADRIKTWITKQLIEHGKEKDSACVQFNIFYDSKDSKFTVFFDTPSADDNDSLLDISRSEVEELLLDAVKHDTLPMYAGGGWSWSAINSSYFD